MITTNLRRHTSDLPPELTGSYHVFKRVKDEERKPLAITVDEAKLSAAAVSIESRRAALRDLEARRTQLEASKQPLIDEYQRLATLNALGESAIADVDRAKARLAAVEKELRELENNDAALVGELDLAQSVIRELESRRALALEQERQRVLHVESEMIRANLATLLDLARQADALATDTAVRFNELSFSGLARTSVVEYPTFEGIVNAFFNRFEQYLPTQGGTNG